MAAISQFLPLHQALGGLVAFKFDKIENRNTRRADAVCPAQITPSPRVAVAPSCPGPLLRGATCKVRVLLSSTRFLVRTRTGPN